MFVGKIVFNLNTTADESVGSEGRRGRWGTPTIIAQTYSSSLLLPSLELSDTDVYEPEIRAHLGTASHFCAVNQTPEL